jgi:hypothetical protein
VVKFDANFKEANERKWSPAIKKLFGVFQKLKSHPKFVEFEEILQDEYLLDRVEQGFTTTTYTEAKFYEDVCAVFKASYQVNARNSPGYLTTTILETFFKDCFRAHRQS